MRIRRFANSVVLSNQVCGCADGGLRSTDDSCKGRLRWLGAIVDNDSRSSTVLCILQRACVVTIIAFNRLRHVNVRLLWLLHLCCLMIMLRLLLLL